jgi:hypothetical protein
VFQRRRRLHRGECLRNKSIVFDVLYKDALRHLRNALIVLAEKSSDVEKAD